MIGNRTLKTGIGAGLTLFLATLIGLKYPASAAVITVLSIQNTKKQSFQMALKRIGAAVIGLVVGSVLFTAGGHNPIMFGLFMIVFIPLAVRFQFGEGIVPAAVLVTHLLTEPTITPLLLVNEMGLMLIGVGVALILNLYMPSIEKDLAKVRHEIEDTMFKLFMGMASALREQSVPLEEESLFLKLQTQLEGAKQMAFKYTNNYLFVKASPFDRYFEMRSRQLQVMYYMREHFSRFFMLFEETEIVAHFTEEVAYCIKGKETAPVLLEKLKGLREQFKASKLPVTREEFENRALLYQFLNDLEHFLEIKKAFRESLSAEELEEYCKGYEIKNEA